MRTARAAGYAGRRGRFSTTTPSLEDMRDSMLAEGATVAIKSASTY